MSKYVEYATELSDPKHLVRALHDLGMDDVEVNQEPVTLYDYHGHRRPQKAEIVIRRYKTGLGASNDIGFARGVDGKYTAVISDYDRGVKFDEKWMGQLAQHYQASRTLAIAKQRGYIFKSRTVENGKIRLQFAVR